MIDTASQPPATRGADQTDLLGGIALGVAALAALATYGGVSLFIATANCAALTGPRPKTRTPQR
jgi:hypothetical protein